MTHQIVKCIKKYSFPEKLSVLGHLNLPSMVTAAKSKTDLKQIKGKIKTGGGGGGRKKEKVCLPGETGTMYGVGIGTG